jgi:unsaturated chondroitin disaccharide hydrolase
MIKVNTSLKPADLQSKLERFWQLSGEKVRLIDAEYDLSKGTPVFTIDGKYTTRGWTEWTEGFLYGSAVLQFDATGDKEALAYGRDNTIHRMASHVSHIGVHDHGFNNLSTYGNLLRLQHEGRIEKDDWQSHFYELALKVSGAVQASRWTVIPEGGYIHSFNGPHSLFIDTIRSVRILMVAHKLGHVLMAEGDKPVSLLQRAIQHANANARYSIFYGEGRDRYDEWGRTAHEAIFNTKDGAFRCPNSQQGFSGFTTWTRGLAWAMCGYAEELEFLDQLSDAELEPYGGRATIEATFLKAARATCDFYLANTPTDGIPYWDTGAPRIHKLGNYLERPAEPDNPYEPVDSTAAAIGAQGLLRLGRRLTAKGEKDAGDNYFQAGLTVLDRLLEEPYLSTASDHQGLLLHSIYHEPNGWDNVPEGRQIAQGESSMWGDYHLRELALYVQRLAKDEPYYTFFGCLPKS